MCYEHLSQHTHRNWLQVEVTNSSSPLPFRAHTSSGTTPLRSVLATRKASGGEEREATTKALINRDKRSSIYTGALTYEDLRAIPIQLEAFPQMNFSEDTGWSGKSGDPYGSESPR